MLATGVWFLDGSRHNAIRRDRLLPVRADVSRIRRPCGRAAQRLHENGFVGASGRSSLPAIGYFYIMMPCARAAHVGMKMGT